eukprot:NODE_1294_length_643_cov_1139.335017_g904_i0.p3 GENE.NODE_1294_length_643_cov_1139.335017_g904_i0~~NODE_1294_length_643_cov_1139.335017_g904_i0.p3  ORF type:complete len:61 (-),score=19.92 NODE_1294_length_643_cov_1139.335017_g904_i0:460-612(-)
MGVRGKCPGICLHPCRSRRSAQKLPGDDFQVPVHASKYRKTISRLERQDS